MGAGACCDHLRSKSSTPKCCAPAHMIGAVMVAIKAAVLFRHALFTVNLPGALQQRENYVLTERGRA